MVKAIVTQGEIRPLEPLPADWQEGQAVNIERADEREPTDEEIERDFAEFAQLCEDLDPAEEDRMEEAIREARRLAKEQVRREMGLT